MDQTTALVVEDNAIVREPLVKLLRHKGYAALGAVNGREALDILETLPPDQRLVVLLDLLMPVMNGLEFLRALRADPRRAGLPVIVLTAMRNDPMEDDIRALGVQGFVRKTDFSIDQLLELIQSNAAE